MGRLFSLAIIALICGCIGHVSDTAGMVSNSTATTISSFNEDFVLIEPNTSNETTTTTLEKAVSVHNNQSTSTTTTTINPSIRTFHDAQGRICTSDGKPLIRMYSKIECEHCSWSGPIFDRVVREYSQKDLIVARHWVFDRKDDALTEMFEGEIPREEVELFLSSNQSTVPYFDFGCRFTRIGNGYYIRNLQEMEEAEFRAIIEELLTINNLSH